MKTRSHFILHPASFILSLALLTALPAHSQWIGGDSGVYNTVGNWSPTFNGTFSANPTSAYDITLNANIAANTALSLNYTDAKDFTLRSDSATNRIFTLSGNWAFVAPTGARTITLGTSSNPITLATGGGNRSIATNNAFNNVIVNATLSGGNRFEITGAGSVTLNADNSNLNGAQGIRSSTNLLISDNNALGTGQFLFNGGSLSASGAARTISNAVLFENSSSIAGTQNLTLNGAMTQSAGNRSLTSSTTGTFTQAGSVFLSELAGTGRTLTLTGANNGTVSGAIADFNGVGTAGGINKSGNGIWSLTNGASTYTGSTQLNGGVLEVSTLANGGTSSSIGASSSAAANLLFTNGSMRYTGGATTTDRLFTWSTAAGALQASGTGAVNFNNTGAVAWGPIDANRTITLGGTNTGTNTLAAQITNNGTGVVTLTKADAGRWVLTNANTYTGNTIVNAGTLVIDGTHIAGSGATTQYDVNSGGTLAGTGTIDISAATNSSGGRTIVVASGGRLEASSANDFTMTLGATGGLLEVSGAAASASPSFLFSLGAPGNTVISLTSGSLNIGSGLLNFADFQFTALSGFDNGVYTLFNTSSAITGSLGVALSGSIGGGTGLISLSGGQDLILTVSGVPEPTTGLLAVMGLAFAMAHHRRRRS